MEIGDAEVRCKRSLEMEPREEMKSFKFPIQAAPTQVLDSTNLEAEEKPHVKNWELVLKYNRKPKDVEKAIGPGNNGSPQRTRSADQIDDKANLEQYTRIGMSPCKEMEQKEQEGCLAPTSTSEPHAGFEVGMKHNSAFESQEYLLPEKLVQDGRPMGKKLKMISRHEVAQKKHRDSLKAKVGQLSRETFLLSHELQKHATMCMQLTDANRLLMDELKKMCEPCLIDILEARNPDNNPQTD